MGVVAAIGAAVSIASGAVGAGKAHKEMRRARNAKQEAKFQMETARQNRQDIINPYAGVTDLSGLATDLSSQITNPFNNMQVSTAAAEMQAEQSDIALANTLDTLEATGASAGGATALAMAALKSKKDVALSLEKQEAKNAELKAQGEQAAQQQRVAATTRFEESQIREKGRVEELQAQGEIFEFQAQEARTNADINMYQSMYQGFAAQQNQASLARANVWGNVASSVGNIATAAIGE
jgi:hypothetical protein